MEKFVMPVFRDNLSENFWLKCGVKVHTRTSAQFVFAAEIRLSSAQFMIEFPLSRQMTLLKRDFPSQVLWNGKSEFWEQPNPYRVSSIRPSHNDCAIHFQLEFQIQFLRFVRFFLANDRQFCTVFGRLTNYIWLHDLFTFFSSSLIWPSTSFDTYYNAHRIGGWSFGILNSQK